MTTRREFIKKGSLLTLVGATSGFVGNAEILGKEGYFNIPFDSRNSSVYSFTEESMKSLIDSIFEVKNIEENMFASVKLVEVDKIIAPKNKLWSNNSSNFSLIFKGIKGMHLEQGIYDFMHPKTGNFRVLLVPVTQTKHYYEVIFNNLG